MTKEERKEYYKKYYQENKSKWKDYFKGNIDSIRQSKRNYKAKNLAKVNAYNKQWAKNNKGKVTAYAVAYKLAKKQAAPKWLSFEQLNQIKEFYVNRPEGYHVDHIIPINGKIVCGLHVPWNLQYLTIKENIVKSNKI